MLPWGIVEIGGMQVDAISESGPIEVGTAVDAVGVQGRALVVISAAAREAAAAEKPLQSLPPARETPGDGSRLSPTLETFEFERLDPPET